MSGSAVGLDPTTWNQRRRAGTVTRRMRLGLLVPGAGKGPPMGSPGGALRAGRPIAAVSDRFQREW